MSNNPEIVNAGKKIEELFGFHFGADRYKELEYILQKSATEINPGSSAEFAATLLNKGLINRSEQDILIKNLTVSETYFFRESSSIKLLSEKIIPELITKSNNGKQPVHIWSAGCSSGEEPYSLAILIRELSKGNRNYNIKISATDLNPTVLKKAETGIYTSWSFRETPENIKEKYFKKRGTLYEIDSSIKKMVNFSRLNLVNDPFPGEKPGEPPLNIILCRNVLMYLHPEIIKRVSEKFMRILDEGGWLITSQVELNDLYFNKFHKTVYNSSIFYRKIITTTNGNKDFDEIESPNKEEFSDSLIKMAKPIPEKSRLKRDQIKKIATLKNITVKSEISISSPDPELLFKETKYREAIEVCEKKIKSGDINKEYAIILVKSLANSGRLYEAKEWMEKLIQKIPDDAELFYLYATVLSEQDSIAEAKVNLIKALYMKPHHLAAQLSLARILKNEGSIKEAQRRLKNLTKDIEIYDDNYIFPDLDDMTAGNVREIIDLIKS